MAEIFMPSFGQTTDNLVINKWLVSVGDKVKRGDVLLNVETDKSVLDVESFASGTVKEIYFKDGDEVHAEDIICLIEDENTPSVEKKESAPASKPEEVVKTEAVQAAKPEIQNRGDFVKASPMARKTARDNGVDLRDLGIAKIVRNADVLEFLEKRKAEEKTENAAVFAAPINAEKTDSSYGFFGTEYIFASIDLDITVVCELERSAKAFDPSKELTTEDVLAKAINKLAEKYLMTKLAGAKVTVNFMKNVSSMIFVRPRGDEALAVNVGIGSECYVTNADKVSKIKLCHITAAFNGKLTGEAEIGMFMEELKEAVSFPTQIFVI